MPRGPYLTEAEKAEVWARRRRGESTPVIARRLGRNRHAIWRLLKLTGGVPPRPRKRSRRELTTGEREEISRGLAAGKSCREMGRLIGRPASTVSREVRRNGGRRGYRAAAAEEASWRRHRRPKPSKLALFPQLRAEVVARLKLNWSPQKISAWLKLAYPAQPEMQISHETIYLSLFVQGRGTLRKELTRHLRSRRTFRQAQQREPSARGQIRDRIMISQRPAEAADRAVPGHWEGDLLLGKPTDAIGTLVERTTRYVMLFRLPGGAINAEAVRQALAKTILKLPSSLRRALTWDQGKEMAEH